MKYLDEFCDPELAGKLVDEIKAATSQRWAIMEVFGGQTPTAVSDEAEFQAQKGRILG
jgi:hydrogenase expression/formation protein HypD